MRALTFAMFVAIAGTAIPASGASAATPSAADAAVRRQIDAVVQRVRATYGGKAPVPGIVIGVWDAHGASYQRAYGFAEVANKRPMSIADHFRIGSNTKTFVVAVVLQLVDEGKLSRSGLVEAYDDPQLQQGSLKLGATFPPQQTIAWALRQRPYFAPGAGYHYSNTNYLLLGMIIGKITHDTVGD
jgi:D-alanyl-D-alanine carboxypeptidase